MSSNAGTLELLARELGLALSLLPERIDELGVAGLLAEMGATPPRELLAAEVQDAITTAVEVAVDLPELIAALEAAIETDDAAAIIAAGGELLLRAGEVTAALVTFGSALSAAAQSSAELSDAQRLRLAAFAELLASRLVDYLLIEHLTRRAPGAAAALELMRVVDRVEDPGVPGDPLSPPSVRKELHWERLLAMIVEPADYAREAYGWGDPNFDGLDLLRSLQRFLQDAMLLPSMLLRPAGQPAVLEAYLVALSVDDTVDPPGLRVSVRVPGSQDVTFTYPLRDPWSLSATASGRFVADMGGTIRPPATIELRPPSGTIQLSASLGLHGERADGDILLAGLSGGTGLRASHIDVTVGVTADWDVASGRAALTPAVEAGLTGGKLAVGLGSADGFLASTLPATLEVGADLAARWDPIAGLAFIGGASLELILPIGVDIGPGRLEELNLRFGIDATGLRMEGRLSGNIVLGPFAASIEGVGAGADLALSPGNLGPADVGFRFLPPRGLGLAIDAGPVSGGGFILFDEAAGRYGGVLQLKISTIGITAIGLLDTKLPGGAQGFALLVVLRAEFPPIQVGFGIALSGVGGLLGLNRRVDVDALRQRFASGAVGRILSPEDPVRNAPLLLKELGAIFPVTEGVTVIGPTVQLSWAELVRLDLGIFIELPGPSKIVLLGSVRATIDDPSGGDAYLQIRLDVLGVLDFTRKVLEFDAVLVDSQLLGILELTGGAAFRLSWGDQPYVVMTVGGFHPAYNPAPLAFPASLTRIAMTRGEPTDELYLRFEGYFAITTNTLQFGAAVQVIVNADPIRAEGFLGFDALIRFEPFSFEFSFQASMTIAFRGVVLAGVRLSGVLSGPGPVTFTGELCLEILFLRICWNGTFTLGSSTPPTVEPVPSALPILVTELRKRTNLSAIGGQEVLVVLTPPKEASVSVLPPLGRLVWSQKRAPLGMLLQRFEGAPLQAPETISASGPDVRGQARDWFAPGRFAELTDGEALNRSAMERLPGGVEIGAPGDVSSTPVAHDVTLDQYRTTTPHAVSVGPLPAWVTSAINRRDQVEEVPVGAPAVTVTTEVWTVSDRAGTQIEGDLSQAQAHQLARARDLVATAEGDRVPTLAF